jgi:hypothetical protein
VAAFSKKDVVCNDQNKKIHQLSRVDLDVEMNR